jgi:hypothetical protein
MMLMMTMMIGSYRVQRGFDKRPMYRSGRDEPVLITTTVLKEAYNCPSSTNREMEGKT